MTDLPVKPITLEEAQDIAEQLEIWQLVRWNGETGDVVYKRGDAVLKRTRTGQWFVEVFPPADSCVGPFCGDYKDSAQVAIQSVYLDLGERMRVYNSMQALLCVKPAPTHPVGTPFEGVRP